jgi:short-subunit dehydrogenase
VQQHHRPPGRIPALLNRDLEHPGPHHPYRGHGYKFEAARPYRVRVARDQRSSVAEKVPGRVIAVTGAARGIGLAIATALHRAGAKVAIGDIDEGAVAEAGDRLGLTVRLGLDVTERQSFTDFLDAVENQLGPIDVLVNNAGVIAVGSAVDEADAVTQRLLTVNVFGVMLGTKLAAQRMLPRRRGHIINIASLGGVLPTEGIATYCATKHAVLGYTDSVRMENRGSGVEFSSIMPTLTNTEMTAGIGHAKGFRNAEPDEVARAVLDVIAKPRPRVVVPRSIGVTVAAQRLLPQGLAEAIGRALGTGRVFTSDLEVEKRAGYARRTGTS